MSDKQYFQGGEAREIEGVKFHIKGAEFIETLNKRAQEHLVAADEAEASLKTASDAMETAREAAAKAGRPAGASYAEMYEAAPTRAVAEDVFECEHGCGQLADDGKRFCSEACAECEHTDFDDSVTDCAGICWG